MNALLHDLRDAARGLIKRPAFSLLVIGVLGGGLTCVIFMLAMLNGFVLRPLPFDAPDQLLHAGLREDGGNDLNPMGNHDLIAVQRRLADIAETAGFARSTMNLSDLDRPERSSGAFVSANLFRVLAVAPMLGRDFSDADARDGAPSVAMLSYELWQSRYGGDPAIVGRQMRVNAQPTTVIGVMPENFSYPNREVIWVAAHLFEGAKADDLSYWIVLRRHTGASDAAIDAGFASWFAQAVHDQPERYRGMQPGIEPLAWFAVSRTIRTVLDIMLAAVVMVLLVACANAANLLLTRTLGRRHEFAVRAALGASRTRLVTQLVAECLLLSLIATVIALPLAHIGAQWQQGLMRAADFGPPLWLHFDIDATVIALALGAALLTAALTGLLSALHVRDTAVADNLRDGTRSVAGGSFARISRILVIGEIALSCALLISVGTMVRGLAALDHVDLGIATDHLLTARLMLPATSDATPADQVRLYERLGERLREDPGVVDATVGTATPGTNFNELHDVLPAGAVAGDAAQPQVLTGAVDDHFLAAYSIGLQQGRSFDSSDHPDGPRVAIVDQRFATRFGAGAGVLGRTFRLDPRDPKGATVTVVGVVPALRLNAPGDSAQPAMLFPLRQAPFRIANVAVRARDEPLAFAPRLNAIMRGVDADTPLYWVRDYAGVISSGTLGERTVAQSFSAFGLIALLLAGAGLYGVMAFSVGQRTREIGVRRALGAPAHRVLRHVFARSVVQLGIGLALGLAAGVPFAHLLTGSMPSIEGSNIAVVASVLAILILAALAAVVVPARRALRVDPTVALRHE
ncbi:MAG: ADOP family duplicated permease [Dokdonella sp.]|uniref:ADOP family duplicated permease n=1 Tax=Dokdonella sp. TaxID=2291710 RepID=UPI0032634007